MRLSFFLVAAFPCPLSTRFLFPSTPGAAEGRLEEAPSVLGGEARWTTAAETRSMVASG